MYFFMGYIILNWFVILYIISEVIKYIRKREIDYIGIIILIISSLLTYFFESFFETQKVYLEFVVFFSFAHLYSWRFYNIKLTYIINFILYALMLYFFISKYASGISILLFVFYLVIYQTILSGYKLYDSLKKV